ncbi:protein kinase [Intrasporangium sp. DVR]|uniref:protein kinase domain-containing protein n=1 Tax=Intrasporangium sp. DVR TaxID=3127867 RepID=UPI00313A62B0
MEAGQVLAGRYAIGRSIGAGGMGQVYAGTDQVLQREVAIKTCPVDPSDRTGSERFQREARAAAALSHRNVVMIHDAGAEAGLAYIVMELLPGPDLARHVAERGPLPEAEAVSIATQVASGLAAAHEAGIIHRDIKPANVLFDGTGGVRIVDFGIARLEQAAGLTAANTVLGSAGYLAPEQVAGQPAEAQADLYALGCVLMTMLTGRPPFEGEHALAVAHQQLSAAPPRVSDRRPDVDPRIDALVAELLAKSPTDRPSSARELLVRLDAIAGAPSAPSAPSGLGAAQAGTTRVLPAAGLTMPMAGPAGVAQQTERIPVATSGAARGRSHAGPPSGRGPVRPPRRRAPWALISTVLVLLLLAGVLWVALGGEGEDPGAAAASGAPSASARTTPRTTTASRKTEAPTTTGAGAGTTSGAAARALDTVRGVISTVASFGGLQDKDAADLGKRLDDLGRQLGRDNEEQVAKKLDDLEKRVDDLAEKGDLSESGHQLIRAALDALDEVL